MIVGYHIIFGAYGFWLPNDPRGSWSDFVRKYELARFGPATKTTERRSLACLSHDRALRLAAKEALDYPPVQFSGVQARSVGVGVGEYGRRSKVIVWACAILPDHVHLVVAKHRLKAEKLAIQFKGAATKQLNTDRLHPFQGQAKCFAEKQWKVYLDPEDIRRAIRYVEDNPLKEGKPRQKWSFVTPYAG